MAFNAGTDLSLGGEYSGGALQRCVASGAVSEARVEEAVNRVLAAQFALGWFDSLGALFNNLTDPVPWK